MTFFENTINNIAKKAAEQNARQSGDYIGDDGLLYCGNCHTAKQCRQTVFGQERVLYCLCKCKVEKRDAEREEQRKAEKALKIQRMRRLGFPDAEMMKWTFDKDDRKNETISAAAQKYVENFAEMKKRGKGILFFGPVGTGKTFISACIANALIDKGYSCLVTNFSRLVNTIQGMFEGKQNYIDSLNQFDLLVIDDLASERDTEYMGEIIQNIIDSRYRAGLPLIVSTNLTNDELKKPVEIRKQRIYSRLLEMCVPIQVAGANRRKLMSTNKINEAAELLGLSIEQLRDINVAERNEEK